MAQLRRRLRRVGMKSAVWVRDTVFWWGRFLDSLAGMREYATSARLRTEYAAGGNGHTVIVLSGLTTPWRFMRPLLNDLARRGYRVIVQPQLGFNLDSVPWLAEQVERYLAVHPELGRVLVVGHSKGGLIAKQLLLNDPTGARTIGAVTLSTPFAGAKAARFVRGRDPISLEMRELRVGARSQLQYARRDAANARVVSLSPLYDQIVGYPGRLVGGRNRTVKALGHNLLLADARVHEIIDRELHRLLAEDAIRRSG